MILPERLNAYSEEMVETGKIFLAKIERTG
jgi:hypothetical protein